MMPPHTNWYDVVNGLYNVWTLSAGLLLVGGWFLRLPIAKHAKRIATAVQSADRQVKKIETLTQALTSTKLEAQDWRSRFSEMEARYEALSAEFARLGQDMHEFRRRMTAADALALDLKHDRDALIDFSRLLIGQMFALGHTPDYPMPSLQSILITPGPALADQEKPHGA